MNGGKSFLAEIAEETVRSSNDICVLLLDSDETYLTNMSEMLRGRGYHVVATTRPDDLPTILNSKDVKVDLVLAEFRLVEMNKYELLDKITSTCEIPDIECRYKGAKFYMKKPLTKSDLENLWKFTIMRQREDFLHQIEVKTKDEVSQRKEQSNVQTLKMHAKESTEEMVTDIAG